MLVHLNYAADSSFDMNLCGADLPESLQLFRGISGLSIHQQIETGHQISTATSGNLGCIVFGRFCRRDSKETADSGAAELLSMFGDDLVSGKSLSIKGQFAAIVFCSQLKRVFLITDHFATVPLYYANTRQAAVVSLLPQVVATSPHVESGIDVLQLARYCLPCFLPNDKTFFKKVSAVPPASVAQLHSGTTTVISYWSLDKAQPNPGTVSPDNSYSRIRSQVASSVSFAIGGRNQVGLLLSGGIDSSVVAYEACEHFGDRGNGHTVIAACATNGHENSTSDCHFASLLSRKLGVPLSFQNGMSIPFEAVDTYFDATGQPPSDMFYAMQLQLLQVLANQGVNVVLCGEGGESSVSSYGDGWLSELLITGKLITLSREIVRSGSLADAKELLWETVGPITDRLFARTLGVTQCFKSFQELMRNHCLAPDFVTEVWQDLKHEIECAIDYPHQFFPLRPLSVRQNDLLNLGRINPAHFYSGKTAGVTLVCPLLDPDLIECVMSAPPSIRRQGNKRRIIAAACYNDRLPMEIVRRTSKSPFFSGYEQWLQCRSAEIIGQLSLESPYFDTSEDAEFGQCLHVGQLHRMHRTAVASRFVKWADRILASK